MESALIVLVWIVGLVVITFFVVIIVAVLKASSDSDDLAERIQFHAKEGLSNRDNSKVQGKGLDDKGTGKGEWDSSEHDVPEDSVSGVAGGGSRELSAPERDS